MSGSGKRCLVLALVFSGFAFLCYGSMEQDRYGEIIRRNAFNLREPAPPKPPPEPPASIKVNLTGITTILSEKRVSILVQEQGKPQESKMLKEGEREGQIEVISIDESAGSVKIKIGDKETELTFEKDGIKPPTAPTVPTPGSGSLSVPSIPGISRPPTSPGMPSTASITPSGSTTGNSLGISGGSMPTRPIRSATDLTPTAVASSAGMPAAGAVSIATPTGQGATLQVGTTVRQPKLQPNWPPEQPVSAEESVIINEAMRLKYQKEIEAGRMPPLPPLPGSPIFK